VEKAKRCIDMKVFCFVLISFLFASCDNRETVHIYLAHCDSIYYWTGENFNPNKIRSGKMNDSAFIKELFNGIHPPKNLVKFKPIDDICPPPEGLGVLIQNWYALLSQDGFPSGTYDIDSTERRYFGNISLKERVISVNQHPPPRPPSLERQP
jgi:hypothetical protein